MKLENGILRRVLVQRTMNRFKEVRGRGRVGGPNRRAIFEDRANERRVEMKNGVRRRETIESLKMRQKLVRFGADI